MRSPFVESPIFWIGPVPFTNSVLTSFAITVLLGLSSFLLSRRLTPLPKPAQTALEAVVSTIDDQIFQITARDPRRYTPLVGTLFIYLVVANSVEAVPLLHAPTTRIETAMALAIIVFCSVYFYGIRENGVIGYLRHYVDPSPLLAPIHILSELTRTLALMVRLLGNIMSHGLVLAIVVSLAGLFVPIPIMAFGLFVGLVQAYIFAMLATVYIGAAVESQHPRAKEQPRGRA